MSRSHPDVMDEQGRPVPLGSKIAEGGEGSVYEVQSQPGLLAKVYHQGMTAERAEKVRIMASGKNQALEGVAAWPAGLLVSTTTKAATGLLMPRFVDQKDVHNLYSPKSRRSEFQKADWRFLVRTAANTARAFGAVHHCGCVIGDVNHGGVLVGQDARVSLIDCDSFQLTSGGRRFLCEVGVETFTPPELQSKSFKGVVRTEDHDNFGLAVLIFLMLFMGRHPFAGRFTGSGDMPISKAIQEIRYPYSRNHKAVQMERPPGTPPVAIAGSEIEALFERAFSRDALSSGRPTALEWKRALDNLEKNLTPCKANGSHWYLGSLSSCPWCPMEQAMGISLFPVVLDKNAEAPFDFESLWRQVEALGEPGPAPELTIPKAFASSEAETLSATPMAEIFAWAILLMLGGIGLFGGFKKPLPMMLIGLGIGLFFLLRHIAGDKSPAINAKKEACKAAIAEGNKALDKWKFRTNSDDFSMLKRILLKDRTEWENVPKLRMRKLEDLQRNLRASQLEKHLDRFKLEKAKIEGIGPGRKQTLESYGIETAADIVPKRLAPVPGIGPKMTKSLLDWRKKAEQKFIFDATKSVDPQDVLAVEQEIFVLRSKLKKQFEKGLADLRSIRDRIEADRRDLKEETIRLLKAKAQAEADLAVLK